MEERPHHLRLADQPAELPAGKSPAPRGTPLVLLAKAALAAGIIAWLCSGRVDLRQLAHARRSSDLAVLVAVLLSSMLLPVFRWWWLLRIQQIDAPLWQTAKLTWIGYFTTLFLPGAAGGDLAKSLLIVRQQPTARARSLSTVVLDRLIGVFSLILLGCFSAGWFLIAHPAAQSARMISHICFAMLVGSTLGIALIAVGPWREIFANFLPISWVEAWCQSYELLRRSKRAIIGCLLLSLASSALTAASLATASRVLGGTVSVADGLLVGPLTFLVGHLPITSGGVGVAEATASRLFAGVGSANGAETMLLVRLVMAAISLPALLTLFGRLSIHISPSLQPAVEPIRADPAVETQPARSRAA